MCAPTACIRTSPSSTARGTASSTPRPGASRAAGSRSSRFRSSRSRSIRTTDTWGLNFSRGVVRKNENIAWVSRNRAYNPAVSGLGGRLRRARPARARRRAFGAACARRGFRDRRRARDSDVRAVARPRLQDHAGAERLADVQHGLLGDRGRRPAGQSHALRSVLSREARLLPARGRHLRVRPHRRAAGQHLRDAAVARERPAVLLAAHRPERARGRSSTSTTARRSAAASATGTSARCRFARTNPSTSIAQRPSACRWAPRRCRSSERASACSASRRSASSRRAATRAPTSTTRSSARTSCTATRACRAAARSRPRRGISRATRPGLRRRRRGDRLGAARPEHEPAFAAASRASSSQRTTTRRSVSSTGANVDVASFDVGYTHRPPRGSYVQSVFTSLDGERVEQIGGGLQTQTLTFRPFLLTNRTGDTLMMVYRDQRDSPARRRSTSRPRSIRSRPATISFDDLGMRFQRATTASSPAR